jgi:hypothetical protein
MAQICHTLQAATKIRITQEVKFLYKKKQILNEELYDLHLACANDWQELWPQILNNIDNKLQNQIQLTYNMLNKKLDILKSKKYQSLDSPQEKKENATQWKISAVKG